MPYLASFWREEERKELDLVTNAVTLGNCHGSAVRGPQPDYSARSHRLDKRSGQINTSFSGTGQPLGQLFPLPTHNRNRVGPLILLTSKERKRAWTNSLPSVVTHGREETFRIPTCTHADLSVRLLPPRNLNYTAPKLVISDSDIAIFTCPVFYEKHSRKAYVFR